MVSTEPKWQSWTDDGDHRTHKNFHHAEKHARRVAHAGKNVEITLGFHTVARVKRDALDRVWTDVVDGEFA